MATRTESRIPLSRDRILRAAIDLADDAGLETLSMRRLGQQLGVEAMSLYNHVDNKDDLLDGVVDLVVTEINESVNRLAATNGWKETLRRRILTAREVLLRHRWAPALLETRTTLSPAILEYYEAVLRIMRDGGFSYDLAHHALHALGSRALGFTQELFDPGSEADEQASTSMLEEAAFRYPHLVGMLSEIVHGDGLEATLGWCDDQTEFEFGLDLLLDGLENRLVAT